MFDFGGFLKLIRFQNLLIIVFTQYMIKIFLIDNELNLFDNLANLPLLLLTSSTAFIAAAGYIINDYYDVKIDNINKPEKVIIGRRMKRRFAIAFIFLFNILGLLLAFLLGQLILLINFSSAFLLWFYSNYLKRLPFIGNFSIALLSAMSVALIGIYFPQNIVLVLLFSLFAFFISLIREIVKDMEDVRGDAQFGCKTLPIVFGIRKTKQIIYIIFAIFTIILLSTQFFFHHYFVLYLYFFVLFPMIYFFIRLKKADTKKEFRYLGNLCKLIMLIGVISMTLI